MIMFVFFHLLCRLISIYFDKELVHDNFQRRCHKDVTNVRYAAVSLTTVRQECCFALSERNSTSPLVTSQFWMDGRGVYNISKFANTVVILSL